MPRTTPPSASLVNDPDVRRWFENLARGSRATADINLRRLDALCKSLGTTPVELSRMNEKQLHDRFLDFVSSEEKRGVAGSYIVRTMKAGKSWLLHNGKKLDRPIRVRGAKDTPSLRDERVPTQEELRKILLAGTARIRTAVALVAFSGLRPEVLGNYLGNDGLTLGDFPELKIGKGTVEFATVRLSFASGRSYPRTPPATFRSFRRRGATTSSSIWKTDSERVRNSVPRPT